MTYPEFVQKFGYYIPDFRGYFLRGVGGKSGSFNVSQDDSVNIDKNENLKIHFANIARGKYEITAWQTHGDIAYTSNFYPGEKLEQSGANTTVGIWHKNNIATNAIGYNSAGMDIPVSIVSPYGETRPVNKAVKYVIKVR